MGGAEALLASLPRDNSVVLGAAFEELSDWVLLERQAFPSELATIQSYGDFARRSGLESAADVGVDRVGIHLDGSMTVVQNKFLSRPLGRVGLAAVSRFLLRGLAMNADRFLLVTSGSGVSENAARAARDIGVELSVLTRDHLAEIADLPGDFRDLQGRLGEPALASKRGPRAGENRYEEHAGRAIASLAELGAIISARRADMGLSQRDFAIHARTTQRYVWELEAGRPKRLDENFLKVLRRLGLQVSVEVIDER